ncbi:hypothetical protein IMG5_005150 [Ichthyophthirius multifiliis]|uniref:Uncharacterized protein n=1 Tax=Ichthyophthirius multifiliis TaxID=5932 RepID=G0QJG2_ICHMU|nr:hypothetical protein IMG5_005150 [Ichthyophthirius multifiliis]EGR34649.1 hypothetical protein IMG5_005150 [Ichthyophthirius multifiliis]|eukprot:XP_004039953.1 hypothetical protein IMG5_005150 [Ichthyophthirius multifiliis]
MNRFFKVNSNYSYYKYLEKYDANFLRRYQSETHYYLGRRGAWRNLVIKYAGDHIALEEEHNFKYKTHLSFVYLSYRLAWFLFGMTMIYNTFLLGDIGKTFNIGEWDYPIKPSSERDYATRYESLYVIDKFQKW